jgi:hypothetical protein
LPHPEPSLPAARPRESGPTLAHAIPPPPTVEQPMPGGGAGDDDDDSTSISTPPVAPGNERILTGEQRVLNTMQRNVARAATEDALETGKAHELMDATAPLPDEGDSVVGVEPPPPPDYGERSVAATDVHEIPTEAVERVAATEVHDIPTEAELAAAIAGADAAEQRRAIPLSTAPASLPPPAADSAAAAAGPTPACPQCDAPMAWVEEHLRFYCKQCRMYF